MRSVVISLLLAIASCSSTSSTTSTGDTGSSSTTAVDGTSGSSSRDTGSSSGSSTTGSSLPQDGAPCEGVDEPVCASSTEIVWCFHAGGGWDGTWTYFPCRGPYGCVDQGQFGYADCDERVGVAGEECLDRGDTACATDGTTVLTCTNYADGGGAFIATDTCSGSCVPAALPDAGGAAYAHCD